MSAKLKEFGLINPYNQIFDYLSGKNDENEIKNYYISISGFGELICFGYEEKLVVASLNYSIHSKYSDNVEFIVKTREIVGSKSSDKTISSVLVIPIASQKQSSQGFPDWSCICVGYNCGIVEFFDQTGKLIFHQQFNNFRIEQIQLHTSPCYNALDILSENLMILCGNCCFQIDGNHLYESLNKFKIQLARSHAGFNDQDLEMFQLSYKKWILDSQDTVVNIAFGYETSDCLLDNVFINASNKGPFVSIPDQVNKFINCATVGKNPFVNFYRLPLESEALDMGDLAQAVYSKMKGVISTSFSSWLGSSRTSKKPETVKKNEPIISGLPSRLQVRHRLEESSRKATMIVSCPQYNKYSRLAAMTDEFGRIFLIDIDEGVIIRMWKGYRDAQISISTSSIERHVNFLLIYAPRRSMIEIWTIPFGERVASFDVRDKNGRLLHVPHGLLGISRCIKNYQKLEHCHSTFFLDSTGKLSVLEIPFHLSLINSSDERSQDHLVLKHFKSFLREQSVKPNFQSITTEISNTVRLLKLTSSVDILINSIISLSFMPIDILISIFNEFIELNNSDILARCSQENERYRLKINCIELQSLITCYKSLTEIQSNPNQENEEQNLENLLNLDTDDCFRINNLYDLYRQYHKQIGFSIIDKQTYHLFTKNFVSVLNSSNDNVSSFQLVKHVLDKDILSIGHVVFNKCITGELPIETVLNLIFHDTKFDQISCFKICMTYLIHESIDIIMKNLSRIKQLLTHLLISDSSLNEQSSAADRHKFVQNCLNIAYDICEKSNYLMTSFVLSMLIRVLICELMQNIQTGESSKFVTYVTDSLLSWNVTCQRLEDLSIFSCLLKCRPTIDTNSKIKKCKLSFDRELTLSYVLENGKGIFSEIFAKWAFKWSLKFSHLNELYKSLGNNHQNVEGANEIIETNLNSQIKDIFAILYKQLPHSLEYDTVLVNVAWEYARLWSKSIQKVEYLQCACELIGNVGPAAGLVIQGVGGMMWDIHVKTSIESLFLKDKNDASKYTVSVLTSIVTESIIFLQIVLKSLENLDVMPAFSSELVWKEDKSRSSLIEVAVTKDPLEIDSIELHIQLLYALKLVALVDLRHVNCLSLYSSDTKKYFFDSLTKIIPKELIQNDLVQSKMHRMRFLERVILSCIMMFNEGSDDHCLCQNIHDIIKVLAVKWQMNIEDIRQCWIINYYKCGLDSQAAMYLDKVENTSLLASNLLKIVGLRLKKEYFSPSQKNYREYYKYLQPQLNKWLQALDDSNVKEASLQKSSILIDQILEWLPENSFEFEPATCLQSLIMNIEKTKKYVD